MAFTDSGALVSAITVRAANEGVPIGAIARIVQVPFEVVTQHLKDALACGKIGELPKPDWPPAQKWAARLPSIPRTAHPEDTEFLCKRVFKLTKLEAAFMMVLLRHDVIEKEKLHGVIEEQRAKRPLRPDTQEATDPKMVDVIICKLRKKLKAVDQSFVLTTSWGSGYYFEAGIKQAIFEAIGGQHGPGPDAQRAPDTGAAS